MPGGLSESMILRSEHNRILSAAQTRYDDALRAHRQIGFWKGVACTVWLVGITAFATGLAAFNLGLNLQ